MNLMRSGPAFLVFLAGAAAAWGQQAAQTRREVVVVGTRT
jgi:hypothetical protein